MKCSYAGADMKENSNVGTIDVVADVKTEKVRPTIDLNSECCVPD